MAKKDCSGELRAHFQRSPVAGAASTWEYEHTALGKVGTLLVTLGRITVRFLTEIDLLVYSDDSHQPNSFRPDPAPPLIPSFLFSKFHYDDYIKDKWQTPTPESNRATSEKIKMNKTFKPCI